MESTGLFEPPKGGRISSPKFRAMAEISDDFEGLPEGVTRLDLLHLVKDVGTASGFTPRMIDLLEYYVIFTRDCDWQDGAHPIVYQSVIKTARHFRVTERQIQYLEKQLFEVGALTWYSVGNNKRYGARDSETGEILFASGIDLSPLAALRAKLEQKKQELQLEDEAWYAAKRQISWYRSRVRSFISEAAEFPALQRSAAAAQDTYDEISYHIRSYMTLGDLHELMIAHKRLHDELAEALEAQAPAEAGCGLKSEQVNESISMDAGNFAHIYSTNHSPSLKRDTSSSPEDRNASEGSVTASSEKDFSHQVGGKVYREEWMAALAAEKSRISWKQVVAACSDRFREHFPMTTGHSLGWPDIVEAAYNTLKPLGISKSAWLEACETLGRDGAALAVMIIDRKMEDPKKPIMNPGGYLRAMTARAKAGELNLHRSIFGLLKREGESFDA